MSLGFTYVSAYMSAEFSCCEEKSIVRTNLTPEGEHVKKFEESHAFWLGLYGHLQRMACNYTVTNLISNNFMNFDNVSISDPRSFEHFL